MSEYVIWNELGNIYIKMGAIDDAISAYLKAIEMNPGYGWPYSNMAYAHVKKGNYEEAIRLYKKSIELLHTNQDKALSWNGLGDTYRYLQDYTSALEAYQIADQISNEPDHPSDDLTATLLFPEAILAEDELGQSLSTYFLRETTIESLDDSGKAKDLFEDLTSRPEEIAPGEILDVGAKQNEQFFLVDGQSENQSTQISEWLRELLHEDAQKETKSLGLLSRGNRKESSNIYPSVANERNDHDSIDTYDTLKLVPGTNQHAIGDATPAVLAVDTHDESDLFAIDPSYQNYVDTEQETKVDRQPGWSIRQPTIVIPPKPQEIQPLDPVMAEIKKYEKIVSLNESNDRAWDTLGKLYKLLGRYDDAIQAFERAIALAPHHEAFHYNLGLVFTVQNRYLDAIESFQNAIALNNQYILAHGALAGCYRRLGKHEEAADHIKLALPLMADESDYNRACFNAICGSNDQAIELLKMALINQDVSLEWVQSDPDLEGIREDARYQALLQDIQYTMVGE